MAAQATVAVDICPEIPDGSPVVPNLRLIFANLPFGRMISAIKHQAVSVLLELPLITLQFVLIDTEIGRAARLRRQQRR
jgi:hypothetical protein